MSHVFPYFFHALAASCIACFTTEQSNVKASLFVKQKITANTFH